MSPLRPPLAPLVAAVIPPGLDITPEAAGLLGLVVMPLLLLILDRGLRPAGQGAQGLRPGWPFVAVLLAFAVVVPALCHLLQLVTAAPVSNSLRENLLPD